VVGLGGVDDRDAKSNGKKLKTFFGERT
jgi:hypothetical protein